MLNFQAFTLSCLGMASIVVELSHRESASQKNKIKFAKATKKAASCSTQLTEYNSLLKELRRDREALIKEKEEFKTLKLETLNVLAASEKCIIENNKYTVEQTKLEEENVAC